MGDGAGCLAYQIVLFYLVRENCKLHSSSSVWCLKEGKKVEKGGRKVLGISDGIEREVLSGSACQLHSGTYKERM